MTEGIWEQGWRMAAGALNDGTAQAFAHPFILRTRAIPKCLEAGVITTRRYTNPRLPSH